MQPSIEYFPECVSGRYYEMRSSDSYQFGAKERIGLFRTADGRWFREVAMPAGSASLTIGVLAKEGDPFMAKEVSSATQVIEQLAQNHVTDGDAQFRSLEIDTPHTGMIRVRGVVINTGAAWWFGWGARHDGNDVIGLRFISATNTVIEARIQFPFECIGRGESHRFEHVFSARELGVHAGECRVEVGMVREGERWFGETKSGTVLLSGEASTFEPLEYEQIASLQSLAFTFDGGSSDRFTEELLDVLRRHEVRCTMFLTGKFISRFPDVVRKMALDGHEIANHTMTHPRLCFDSDPCPCVGVTQDSIVAELRQTAEMYSSVTGKEMAPLWRAPYGHRNSLALLWARGAGYRHIFWGYDSKDWRVGLDVRAPYTAAKMAQEASDFIHSPAANSGILLFHLASADKLDPIHPHIERLIAEAKSLGFKLGAVGDLI